MYQAVRFALFSAAIGKLNKMPLRIQRGEGVGAVMTCPTAVSEAAPSGKLGPNSTFCGGRIIPHRSLEAPDDILGQ